MVGPNRTQSFVINEPPSRIWYAKRDDRLDPRNNPFDRSRTPVIVVVIRLISFVLPARSRLLLFAKNAPVDHHEARRGGMDGGISVASGYRLLFARIRDDGLDRHLAPLDTGDLGLHHQYRIHADGLLEFGIDLDGVSAPRNTVSRYQESDPANDVVHDAAHAAPVAVALVALGSSCKVDDPRQRGPDTSPGKILVDRRRGSVVVSPCNIDARAVADIIVQHADGRVPVVHQVTALPAVVAPELPAVVLPFRHFQEFSPIGAAGSNPVRKRGIVAIVSVNVDAIRVVVFGHVILRSHGSFTTGIQ
mmetsp:Transcript_12220/g.28661  ORF Transcript_12220/g.28661 Transcript_12220/m.28661 type:complete len:305 (-) Transcript_12220:39-953(-)